MTLDLDPIKRRLAESGVVNPGADTQRVQLSAEMLIHAPSDLAALVAEVERLRGVEVAAKAASALLLTARSELIAMWIHGELDMDRIHDELLMPAHVTLTESLGEPSPTN